MDVCDCRCDDKVITGKWCDKNESQEDIKRAGDIIKDSEQCDIVPNTQKGVFRLWCRLRKIIKTICDVMQRMVCLQKKIKSLCVTLHCMKANILEANSITVKRNKDMIKKYKQKEPNTPNDKKGIYNEAKAIYEEQLKRLEKAKKRLEEMKNDPNKQEIDGIYISGDFDPSRAGSYDYYSKFSLATAKEGVDYVVGGIGFGQGNSPHKFQGSELAPGLTYTLRNVARTTSGKTVNVKITINEFYSRSDASSYYKTGLDGRYLQIYSSHGGISFDMYKIYKVKGTFDFTDDSEAPLNLMNVMVISDIDWLQSFWASFNNSQTVYSIPGDADIVKEGSYFKSTHDGAYEYEKSVPKGSMLMAGVATQINFEIIGGAPDATKQHGDDPDPSNWVMDFFGNNFKGETVDLHEPPKPIPPIEECDLMSCDFDCLGDN